jgi:hypothetical protein
MAMAENDFRITSQNFFLILCVTRGGAFRLRMWVDSSKWQAHTQEKTNEWLYTAGERKKEKFLDGDALYCLSRLW